MHTRSQGPPSSPSMECTVDPSPNPKQVAKEQAEAIRVASQIAKGGLEPLNGTDKRHSDTESGEIPPVNVNYQGERAHSHTTSENSPEVTNRTTESAQSNETSEIPPENDQISREVGAIGGVSPQRGNLRHSPKLEQMSEVGHIGSPTNLMGEIVDGQQFMDLFHVMRNSAIASNLSSLLSITATTAQKTEGIVTMDWILPDSLNSKLEDMADKEMSNFPAPGNDSTHTQHTTVF